jgi:hypothetical protein
VFGNVSSIIKSGFLSVVVVGFPSSAIKVTNRGGKPAPARAAFIPPNN